MADESQGGEVSLDQYIELLELAVWPLVVVILVIVFLLLFRKEIKNRILKIKRVDRSGVVLDGELPTQDSGESNASNILEHIELEKSVLLTEVEKSIFEDLKANDFDTESATTKVLVRHLAVAKIYLGHEHNYESIFGSQIFLLKRLNEASGSGRDRQYVDDFYKQVQERHPDLFEKWQTANYLKYLYDRGLITDKNDSIHITDKGQDFIVWITKASKQENKAY